MTDERTTAPPKAPRSASETQTASHPKPKRPTGWIVITVLLAVAVVVLAIWAAGAQSDADDAQAKLDAQATPAAVSAETQETYEAASKELGQTEDDLDQIQSDLDDALAAVDTADQARENAAGAADKVKAELDSVKARSEVTRACLRGSLDALGAAFSSGGLTAAADELGAISGKCRSAASS
jgi:septal ring factor EnvC (AmiA/AmiB activator)